MIICNAVVVCFAVLVGAIEVEADVGQEEFFAAVNDGDVEKVKALLEAGADIEATERIYGRTALHSAAWFAHRDVVKVLLSSGADVNATDKEGATALMFAAYFGNYPLAKLLVDNGADVEIKANGQSALSVAEQEGHEAIEQLLKAELGDSVPSQPDQSQEATAGADEFGKQLFAVLRDQDYESIRRYLWHEEDWAVVAALGQAVTEEQKKSLTKRITEELRQGIAYYHEQYFKIGSATYQGEPIHSVEYVRFEPGRSRQVSPEYTQYNDSHLVIKINGSTEQSLEIDHIQVLDGRWRISEIM